MTITAATTDDIEDVIALAIRLSMMPEHHIGYFGATPEEVSLCVRKLVDAGAPHLVARDNGRLVGMLAVETDTEIGRGWLHGPLVEHDDWDGVADRLYHAAVALLPEEIAELEIYCDLRNLHSLDLAARHGYDLRGDWDILNFFRHQLRTGETARVRPVEPRQHRSVVELHDRLFPDANTPGMQMIGKQGEHARLLVIGERDEPDGYIFLTVEPGSGEAFIDFLGVDERAQGQGIGGELVQAGTRWLFGFESIDLVCLAVRTDNAPALRLYERAGFVLERKTRAFRKRRET